MQKFVRIRIVGFAVRSAIALSAAAALTGGALGCQHKDPSSKEQAQRSWSSARASVLAGLARDQYQSGNFDKSRETIQQAMKLDPQNESLHILSAKLAIEQGQLELAEKELTVSRQYAPNDPEAWYLSGVVYQRWQKYQAAYDFYHTATEKSPAELSFVMAEAEMLVALDRSNEALTLLQSKVNYFEHSGAIRDAVGQILTQQGKYSEAVVMFRQASILAEDDESIRERLAAALFSNKEYREAADHLIRLVQSEAFSKRADFFIMLGEAQMKLSQAREARASFETASQIDPNSARVWQCLGRSALEAGDYRRAELALRKCLSLDASTGETHLLLGYVKLRQNKLNEALTAFQKASTLSPEDTVSLCMVGYVFEKLGRSDAAMRYYARALKMKPGDDLASQLMAGVDLHDQR